LEDNYLSVEIQIEKGIGDSIVTLPENDNNLVENLVERFRDIQ
jgi:hypothetical protein